ncbi:MAG: C40 family peptidase [Planctomycetales bacterium]|nr:C40 family peptidase [Planctomycetales bacterium]
MQLFLVVRNSQVSIASRRRHALGILLGIVAMFVAGANGAGAQSQEGAPPSNLGSLERIAKKIEPDLQGRPKRLTQYVNFFQSQLGNDARLFAFDVDARVDANGRVALEGYVEFPETRTGLEKFLHMLGFQDVDNRLQTLPANDVGDARFGLVKTTHTLSYDSPQQPRGVVTDCLLGEPLYVLREAGDFLLVHSGEGYLGYVAAADVLRVEAAAFENYATAPAVAMVANFETDGGLVLPEGAALKGVLGSGGLATIELPTGETVEIPADKCRPAGAPADDIEQIVATGRLLLGTPYHWGGKTTDGVDCSGLVQVSFAAVGLHLSRDANQQYYGGRLTATRWHRGRLRRGDTLYFAGEHGKIRHTAIYLGDDQFLHATMPRVTIGSFNPEDANYDERRDKSFVFAKRLW